MSDTGRPKPPRAGMGRPKGSLNKTTASTKAALTAAFEGLGGVPSLIAWGEKNRGDFYALWGRLIPKEVDVTSKGESLAPQTWIIGGRSVTF